MCAENVETIIVAVAVAVATAHTQRIHGMCACVMLRCFYFFLLFDLERKKRGKLQHLYQKIIYSVHAWQKKIYLNDFANEKKEKMGEMMVLFFFRGNENFFSPS